jgi:hypothetical protein
LAWESIVIDARFEWYEIFDGQHEAGEIMDRWRKLARFMNETEGKYFPDDLPANAERQRLADAVPISQTSMASEAQKMAKTGSGETVQKVVHKEGVGKCTLAGNLHSSIPMPRGATPPLRPPNRAQRTAAKCLARRGRKRTAEANKTVIHGIAV